MIDLWTAMAGATDGGHLDPNSEIPIGEAYRLAAEWLTETLDEINGYYPLDLWPRVEPDEMAALHDWAKYRGSSDGSRFHVAGIRHALTLVETIAQPQDMGPHA